MEYKNASQLEIKSADDGTGTFSGYLAVFGDVDSDNDAIVKGAFRVSLASKRLIPILWQHTIVEPIGVWTELKEDDHGLLVTGKLAIDTPAGARAYSLLKMLMESAKQFDARGVFALSIGYKAVQFDRVKGVRYLKEIKLFEGSFVTFSSNNESNVTSVKAADKGTKVMTTFKETLAAHELRKDLSNQKWTVEDAKDDSMDSIMCDPAMDKEAKKKAARKTLHDAADAHADIQDQKIDTLPEVDEPADLKELDTDSVETKAVKAAKKSLAGVIAMHVAAARKCDQAMYKFHQSQALSAKAIAETRLMDYAAINAHGDKTPPQPMGGKSAADLAAEVKAAADKVEHEALVASIAATRAKFAA